MARATQAISLMLAESMPTPLDMKHYYTHIVIGPKEKQIRHDVLVETRRQAKELDM